MKNKKTLFKSFFPRILKKLNLKTHFIKLHSNIDLLIFFCNITNMNSKTNN